MKLQDICEKATSNIAQKDISDRNGIYPIYGASGFIKNIDSFAIDTPYIGIVKDGAGVGRVMLLPAKSSVIGTMQYILPKTGVDVAYLRYLLESMDLSKYSTGATIPHIYFKDYGNEQVKEYSETDQKRIADELDKVSGLIEKRQKQLEKLDLLIKSRFVEMFGNPAANPFDWEIKKLKDVALYYNGLTYKPTDITNNGIIVLRSSNIQNGELDFNDIVKVNVKIKDKLLVKKNDILMCSRNGSSKLIGKVALIDKLNEPMTFGAFMMIIRSKFYNYLNYYFRMSDFKRQISSAATTTINQITSNMLNNIELPLPPIELQNQFADFVEKVEQNKLKIKNSLDKLITLKKALMQKYFG